MQESSSDEILREAVNKLKKSYKVHAIILFGSRARKDHKPWSDYDLLIIADFKEKFLERIGKLLELLPSKVEPHPYTLSEAIEMLKRGNITLVDALEEGVLLYSDEEFEILRQIYKEMVEKGLRRSKVSIILPESEETDSQKI
ncbi:MAG: nucleotidyltransferase domain-containing protein [Archaeoglobaceae archaeon]